MRLKGITREEDQKTNLQRFTTNSLGDQTSKQPKKPGSQVKNVYKGQVLSKVK